MRSFQALHDTEICKLIAHYWKPCVGREDECIFCRFSGSQIEWLQKRTLVQYDMASYA